MKKMTARFLALIVALCVLMVSSAAAEANPFALPVPEKNMATLTIGNFDLEMNGETYSLPLYLSMKGGVDIAGERGLLTLDLSTADQTAASAYAVVENGEIKAYLDGMEYGFTLPLEQVAQQLEAELGAALTDLSEQIPEELQTAVTNLMNSAMTMEAAGEADPAVVLAALGITAEAQGTTEVIIFEEAVTAEMISIDMPSKTIAELMDAMREAVPGFDAYWNDYTALISSIAEESGEEINVDEALAMVSVSAAGEIYSSDTHVLAELTLGLTVEGETVYVPFSVAMATLDNRDKVEFTLNMEMDGEAMLINLLVDETALESGSDFFTQFSMYIGDEGLEEIEGGFDLSVSNTRTTEGVYYSINLYAVDYDDAFNAGFEYYGQPAEIAANGDESYTGTLGLYLSADDIDLTLNMDTGLTLSVVPEGDLLILPEGSINVLEITEEQIEALENDVKVPVMKAAGVLMQDETLASMLLGAMN